MIKSEHIAKDYHYNAQESISIEKLEDGDIEIVATSETFNPNNAKNIRMRFSKNGFAALVGTMRAFEGIED